MREAKIRTKFDKALKATANEKEVSRRGYVKYAAAGVVIVAAAGAAAYYGTRPPAQPTETPTATVQPTVTTPGATTPVSTPKPFRGQSIHKMDVTWSPIDSVKYLIDSFERDTGGEVLFEQTSFDEAQMLTMRDLTAGTGKYDVFWWDVTWVTPGAPYLQALNDWVERDWDEIGMDDFAWAKHDFLMLDYDKLQGGAGNWIGLPTANHVPMFYWRRKEAEEAGWTEDDIKAKVTTFGFDSPLDEFFESVNDPANDRYATVVRGKRGHHIMSDFYHFAYPMGSSWFDGSYVGTYNWVPTYNDAPNVEAADYYGHLIRDFCPPGTENFEHHHREEAFSTGRAINSVGENCFMLPLAWTGGGENRDTLSPGADKQSWYDCGFLPTPTAKRKIRWWPGEFPQLMNGKSKSQELAWEWIKYCCLPENEDTILVYGNSICRYSTANEASRVKMWSEDKPEEGTRARPWLATWPTTFSDGTKPRPVELPEYPEHDDIAGTALNLVVIQEMTAQEALDEAQSKIEKVMRDAGYAEKFWSKAPADLRSFVNM